MAKANSRKQRSKVPENETAEQKTKRLAEFRVSRAVKDIGSIAALAGASYTLTKPQKEEIEIALDRAFQALDKAFKGETAAATGFSLTK